MQNDLFESTQNAPSGIRPRGRSPQGLYWIGTIPEQFFVPIAPLPLGCMYVRGQLETGEGTGFRHWQLLLVLVEKKRLPFVIATYPGGHWELSRSDAADAYVWKEQTRVEGTQFELGSRKLKRNSSKDWDTIRRNAQSGDLESIPSDVYIRCYNQIKRIRADHLVPIRVDRICYVFWGATGTGKSRNAWELAGDLAYAKDPCTKWWCGYRGQKSVIIDEFRGLINISHLLRWLDRYPVCVETKGSSEPLVASEIYITSNVDPRNWYPDLDEATRGALLRRMQITKYDRLNLN